MKNNHVELFGTLTRNIEVSKNGKGNNFVKFFDIFFVIVNIESHESGEWKQF